MTTKIWEASFEGIIEKFCVHIEGNILLDTRERGINIKKKMKEKNPFAWKRSFVCEKSIQPSFELDYAIGNKSLCNVTSWSLNI